jgi:hypothetical protein
VDEQPPEFVPVSGEPETTTLGPPPGI